MPTPIRGVPLKVVLLGSSPLLIQSGLTESLAGRFEVIPAPHWSFTEMREAFGWNLEQYVFYGAYPGAAELIDEPERWRRYILDSLIETTISRDILLLTRVDKPALLRRLFQLGCAYSGRNPLLPENDWAAHRRRKHHHARALSGIAPRRGDAGRALQIFFAARCASAVPARNCKCLNTALMSAQDQRSMLGGEAGRRLLGPAGRILRWRTSGQFQFRNEHQRHLLARAKP